MTRRSVGLWPIIRYFLYLGTFGFGGPVALVGYMQRVALAIEAPPARLLARLRSQPLLLGPAWLGLVAAGLVAPTETLARIFWFFAKAGAFVFGSGLAIVPFLCGGVVQEFKWLDDRQFFDAVAVAMITPGPVVITVAFIGYLVAGGLGAMAAVVGVFLPVYLFVVIPYPWFDRWSANPQIQAFVRGVTAAAAGAIAGACYVLGTRAIHDVPTILIALVALALLWRLKLPEPVLIAAAGITGLRVFTTR